MKFIQFDDNIYARVIFLDISKAFDKAWQKDPIYTLKQTCLSSNILNTIIDFPIFKKQRVVLTHSFPMHPFSTP